MKRILLVLFFVSFYFHSNAQKFSVGVKGGAQLSTMRYQDRDLRKAYSNRPKGGVMGGVLVDFPLPDNFSFVAESMLSIKGRKLMYNESKTDSSYYAEINKSTFYFIENALLLRKEFRMNFYEFQSSWYFNIGPNIAYWMAGEGVITTTKSSNELHYTMRFVDSVYYDQSMGLAAFQEMQIVDANRWIFGLDVGVGFKTKVYSRQTFIAEMRFTYGHTYLGQSYSPNLAYLLSFNDNFKNAFRTLNVTVGYSFNLDIQEAKKGKSTMDKKMKGKRK